MPATRETPWLICYDIADPRRLQRVHRVISRRAIPFQYSIYYTSAVRKDIESLLRDIAAEIDPRRDDVRAYPLLTTARPFIYGRSRLPDRVMLLGSAGMLFPNV